MAKKTSKGLTKIQVISMKDERDESDFLKLSLRKKAEQVQTDINSATIPQLRQLLFIDDTRIEQIGSFRERGGVFYSEDEFFDFLHLKPHERNALKPYVLTGKSTTNIAEKPKNRRRIDF